MLLVIRAAWNYIWTTVSTHPFNFFYLVIIGIFSVLAFIVSLRSLKTSKSQAQSSAQQAAEATRSRQLNEAALAAQTEDTKKALEIAQRNAHAAEASASATKALAEVGQRAWITVAEIKTKTTASLNYPGAPNDSVSVVLTMRNGGNSPALEFVCRLWFDVLPQAITQIDATSLDDASAGVVGPHEQLQLEPRFQRFTQEEWDQLREKTQFLLLYGICRYKDIFKVTHYTRWCYRYVWETQQFAPWNAAVNTMD